jgi:Ni/Fe-hydrogenase subunit HybB-like protein
MSLLTPEQKRNIAEIDAPSLGSLLISVLGMLVLTGLFASVGRLLIGLGGSTGLSDTYPWGIWIGFDFLLIAFSGAGFTMAGLVHVLGREKYHPAMRSAVLAGLMGYMAVLLILLLDLGRFDRFYHFLIFWNVHSPLFEICWCVLLYTTVLVVEASPFVFERLGWERPLRWVERIMLPVAIAGVTLSSLHQSTLGTLYLNLPHRLHELWYTPLLPLFFFLSSIMAGLSLAIFAYIVCARVRGQKTEPGVVDGLAKGVGWVTGLYVVLKLGDIFASGEIAALFAFDRISLLMWIELGLGAFLPAVLLLTRGLRAHRVGQLGGPALVLMGVLFNRFNATLLVQSPPAATASYSPHIVEWLTTAGIIAAAALAWYLGVRLLALLESDVQH